MKKILFLLLPIAAIILMTDSAKAQVKYSVVAGGGIGNASQYILDNEESQILFGPTFGFQLGGSVRSTFRKNGKLGWEARFLIRRSSLDLQPLDSTENIFGKVVDGLGVEREAVVDIIFHRNRENFYQWNYWTLNIPIGIDYQVFGPVGFNLGADMKFLLTEFPEDEIWRLDKSTKTRISNRNLQAKIGVYYQINTQLRIEGQGFYDIEPWISPAEPLKSPTESGVEYRERGIFLNLIYSLN